MHNKLLLIAKVLLNGVCLSMIVLSTVICLYSENAICDDTGVDLGKARRYNFVILLTDDQRWDTLEYMPILQDRLANRGIMFTNAFASTPVCAPSRASLLAGGSYAHNTGVLYNFSPNGGIYKFRDEVTVGSLLQRTGYKTALIGKYINEYEKLAPYVPPGWTKFLGLLSESAKYYDFKVVRGRSGSLATQGKIHKVTGKYSTDFLGEEAINFLKNVGKAPFFLFLSLNAPHKPAVPASQDRNLFSDFLYHGRAYGEEDLSDKPFFISSLANRVFNDEEIKKNQILFRNELRSLQSVDRSIGAIIAELESQGKLNDTFIFFASDNGYLFGEHRISG